MEKAWFAFWRSKGIFLKPIAKTLFTVNSSYIYSRNFWSNFHIYQNKIISENVKREKGAGWWKCCYMYGLEASKVVIHHQLDTSTHKYPQYSQCIHNTHIVGPPIPTVFPSHQCCRECQGQFAGDLQDMSNRSRSLVLMAWPSFNLYFHFSCILHWLWKTNTQFCHFTEVSQYLPLILRTSPILGSEILLQSTTTILH